MRILALAILVIGAVYVAAPAHAQRYDPNYPVCLHVYQWGGSNYYDCSFTSLPQCNASASGRSATCSTNPYFAQPTKRPIHR